MSTYQEFSCKVCGFHWETLDHLAGCPRCRLVEQLEKMGIPSRLQQLEALLTEAHWLLENCHWQRYEANAEWYRRQQDWLKGVVK